MSKEKEQEITEIKEDVAEFPWEIFKRSYDSKGLQNLYWHCVVSDVIGFYRGNYEETKEEGRKKLILRLYRSFLGCFFDAHQLEESILLRFYGLHSYYVNEKNDQWEQWKRTIDKKKAEQFHLICETIKMNHKNSVLIKAKSEGVCYDVTAYDDKHPQLAQKPSKELIAHLRHGGVVGRKPETSKAVFLFEIKSQFIDHLHDLGLGFFKSMWLYQCLGRIEKRLGDGEDVIREKRKLEEDETIKDAILKLFGSWPKLRQLENSQLAKLIHHKYKDSSGNALDYDSIKKALSRMDEKERKG